MPAPLSVRIEKVSAAPGDAQRPDPSAALGAQAEERVHPAPARSAPAHERAGGARDVIAGALVAPMMLSATLAGILFVMRGPDRAFAIALAALVGSALCWILVCVFLPARPDRRCPSCHCESLRRLDPHTTRGLACVACGHVDPEASSFLFAEEDGAAIESMLLRGRQDAHRRTR